MPSTSTLPATRPACLLILCVLLAVCRAHAYDTLCGNGSDAFEAHFRTGVRVYVGPPTTEGLATRRVCRAVLSWDGQQLVVAIDAAEIDLDLFGADLGVDVPVAAFQIKKSASDCCVTYEIYSLSKPPHLLRRLHGGGYFRAADTKLDGQIEIWTDDSAAVDGFEGLHTSEMEFPPTLVLRFEHNRLLDVSSGFRPYFDRRISNLQKKISPEQLREFQQSYAKLEANGRSQTDNAAARQLHLLKTRVLEIVCAYLYSNREEEAWKTLREMWPPGDVKRIRAAIIEARGGGLRAQLDGVSNSRAPFAEEHVYIYPDTNQPARPIMTRYYPPTSGEVLREELRVDLVVDVAGKVWSVKVSGKNKAAHEYVTRSTANWKFIPAFAGDQPVASRVHFTISPKR